MVQFGIHCTAKQQAENSIMCTILGLEVSTVCAFGVHSNAQFVRLAGRFADDYRLQCSTRSGNCKVPGLTLQTSDSGITGQHFGMLTA